jgi:Xaa-Pro aminopeptidase
MDRIKKVQAFLESESLDALLVQEPHDLFYLTGLHLSAGQLYVGQKETLLFVDGRYTEAAKATRFHVEPLESFSKYPTPGQRIGFDGAATSYQNYTTLFEKWGKKLIAVNDPIKKLRAIKEKGEIELLKKAAELGSRGFDFALTQLKEGVSEEQIASELEIFWKKQGARKVSFEPIIAFGPNSSKPHYRAGGARLCNHDVVLIDIGVMRESYASDMTRVVAFGSPPAEMQKIYGVVKEAFEAAVAKCRPGASLADLDLTARAVIEKAGYGEFFPHSLGHGVGLEVHELPVIRKTSQGTVEEGMVFTIEPGIYIPGLGGVRLEDTIVITSNGYESLTKRPFTLASS